MSELQHQAAQRRMDRESKRICPACNGSGRVTAESVGARARGGGNASYVKSLQPGQQSMTERGRRGGTPREASLSDLIDMNRSMGP